MANKINIQQLMSDDPEVADVVIHQEELEKASRQRAKDNIENIGIEGVLQNLQQMTKQPQQRKQQSNDNLSEVGKKTQNIFKPIGDAIFQIATLGGNFVPPELQALRDRQTPQEKFLGEKQREAQALGLSVTEKDTIQDLSKAINRENRLSELRLLEQKADIEIGKQIEAQEGKASAEIKRNKNVALLKLNLTMDKFTDVLARQMEIDPNFKPTRLGGVQTFISGLTGENEEVAAFKGQLVEAAASIAKIAAPSARVGEQLIERFKATLPGVFSTDKEGINQIVTSMSNALTTDVAVNLEEYFSDSQIEVFAENPDKFLDAQKKLISEFTTKMTNRFATSINKAFAQAREKVSRNASGSAVQNLNTKTARIAELRAKRGEK